MIVRPPYELFGRLAACLARLCGRAAAWPTRVGRKKGEVLLRGVGTLRYLLVPSENSACQMPICAVAA